MKKPYAVYSHDPDRYGSSHTFTGVSRHASLSDAIRAAKRLDPAFVKRFDYDGLRPSVVFMTNRDEVEFLAGPYDLR